MIVNGEVAPGLRFDATTVPPVTDPPAEPWSSDPSSVERFVHLATLDLDRDSWIVVEAGDALDGELTPDPFASQIVPGLVPFGFTNPIFVDLEGDGFDPPGVGGAAPPSAGAGAGHPHPHRRFHRHQRRHPFQPGEGHDHLRLQDIEFPLEGVRARVR